MSNKPVLGASPVSFVDRVTGIQRSIPLSLLQFADASSAPNALAWPGYAGYNAAAKAQIDSWLAELAKEDRLTPGAAPPPAPAFSIAARDPGSAGDGIKLYFTKVAPNAATPEKTAVDVTVQATQTYPGLTLLTLVPILGRKTPAAAGSRPGLVLPDADPAGMPSAFEGDVGAAPASVAVPRFGGGTAFTLLAARGGADAKLIHVKISQVDQGAGTFTLTTTWTKSATGVALADLQTQFAYLLTVTAPAAGFANPPATGQVTLTGGSDGAGAAAAGAVVLSQ